ncbi:acyltransferase family protein [Rhodobacterales bacterium HKCCSP123]|nr:acyltransferase family protein [Rhodobacterales bacterium HKCCSP123]
MTWATAAPAVSVERSLRAQSTAPAEKLLLLEVGRAIAALLVVLHHADQATAHFSDVARERVFVWGQYGVDFFFVLSGFIIFYSHMADPPGLGSARLYLFKRVTRIFVPYLPVALAWMALLMVFQEGPVGEQSWGVWATLTLLPMEKASALTVAWTLTYELMFYALFLLAFVSVWVFAAASLAWAGLLLLVLLGVTAQGSSSVGYAVTNPIVLEFFCGVLAAWAFTRVDPRLRAWILLAGCIALAVVIVFWTGQRALLGPPLALIVLSCAMYHPEMKGRSLSFAVFLGAASYAIYLVHSPVVSVTAEVLQPLGARGGVFGVCVLLGTGLGVAYHVGFERPALKWVRRFGPARGLAA